MDLQLQFDSEVGGSKIRDVARSHGALNVMGKRFI